MSPPPILTARRAALIAASLLTGAIGLLFLDALSRRQHLGQVSILELLGLLGVFILPGLTFVVMRLETRLRRERPVSRATPAVCPVTLPLS